MTFLRPVRAHYPLLIALMLGILVAGPFVVAGMHQGFRGPLPELANDQNFYLSRIQDVRDGYPMSGNTYLAEDKSAVAMQFLTAENIEAWILSTFSFPTWASVILFALLLTPIIFFVTYAILCALKAPRSWAAILASLLCFGIYFTALMRPVSPQFNFIFWLLAAWGLVRMPDRPTWRWAGLQSLAVGALFYLYPYYWTHLVTVYGILVLWYLVRDRMTAVRLAGTMIGALIVGAGYVALVLRAHALPDYAASLSRLGFIVTHTPSGIALAAGSAILAAVVIFFAYRRRIVPAPLVATLALVVGGLVAMNQHVLTGINMEFSSHYAMQIAFSDVFLAVAAIGTFGWWKHVASQKFQILGAAIVILIATLSIVPIYQSAPARAERDVADGYTELTSWLNTYAPPGSVIYAPEAVSIFIPAYTSDDVFYARNANIAFMPDSKVMDRFIIQNFRAHIDADFIIAHEREIFGHHYINLYQHALQKQKFLKLIGIHTALPERIPPDAIATVEARAAVLQSGSFAQALAPYRADYIVIDTAAPDQLTKADLAGWRLMFTAAHLDIFGRR